MLDDGPIFCAHLFWGGEIFSMVSELKCSG